MNHRYKYKKYKSKYKILTLENNTEIFPKNIYMFWHKRDLPYLVKKCFLNIKNKNPDYKVFLFHLDDIINFQDRPKILKNYWIKANADWLRLYLLKKYGGIWIDISCIFIFKNLNDFVDHSSSRLQGFTFPQDNNIMENWFLASPKNNPLIDLWLSEWEIALLNKGKYVKDNIQYSSDELKKSLPYLTQHLIFSKITKKNDLSNNFKFINKLTTTDDHPLYIFQKNNWDIYKSITFLCTNKDDKIFKNMLFIKLIGHARNKFIELIDKCKFSEKSIIIKLLDIYCKKKN